MFEAFDDVLAVLDTAIGDPHACLCVKNSPDLDPQFQVDDKPTDLQTASKNCAHQQRESIHSLATGVVVELADEAAHGDARTRIEQRQHCLEHHTADVLEINADVVWPHRRALRKSPLR